MPADTEHLVIGSGVAGLRAAIELAAAGARVLVLTKDGARDSTTWQAQGGIAAVLSDSDRIEDHVADTVRAGHGLCDEGAVRILAGEGPGRVRELIDWGTRFDREGPGLAFTREAAHSHRRVVHAGGDATGVEIIRSLLERAEGLDRLRVAGDTFVGGLIVEDGVCRGVQVLGPDGGAPTVLRSRSVLLATGGLGSLYRETSNPEQATGEGLVLAWDAGAELMDLEFVQFHPTVLDLPAARGLLLTEALRGEGGMLRNEAGERFMVDRHPLAELAPRDVVTREIVRERAGGKRVFLDLRHLESTFVRERFPNIRATCARYGLDLPDDPIPVRPAAHYAMGGVRIDLHGRSSVPGLYAAGEAACLGVHGANRLASNSLLDGLVFGARAGRAMLGDTETGGGEAATAPAPVAPSPERVDGLVRQARAIAGDVLGPVRRGPDLGSAVPLLERHLDEAAGGPPTRRGVEARGMLRLAALMTASALWRAESRGGHFREDTPQTDDARFRVHRVASRVGGPFTVPADRGARAASGERGLSE